MLRFLQPRPKSVAYVPVKMPDELKSDIEAECRLYAKPKSVSDWLKEAAEFRLTLTRGLRVGYYTMRQLLPEAQAGTGNTKLAGSEKVSPPSKEAV